MGKIVAIHQPNYLPYIGYFQKMALSDVFVILDTVHFSSRSYTQRVKIRTKAGWMWLTIPIEKKYHIRPIKDIYLPEDKKWMNKHKNTVIKHYSKCKYFDERFVNECYSEKFRKLHQVNEFGIFYLKDKFGIETEIVRASELRIDKDLKSTELLIEIVKQVGGGVYISGMGGKKYMEEAKFEKEGTEIKYFEFKPFEYPQRWEGFEQYMSSIDLLFNVGWESKRYYKQA